MWVVTAFAICIGIMMLIARRDRIPPHDETVSNMEMIRRNWFRFAEGRPLDQPFELKDKVDEISPLDGCGKPIECVINGDVVTLRSSGCDPPERGSGEDEDIVGKFKILPNARATTWIVDPATSKAAEVEKRE